MHPVHQKLLDAVIQKAETCCPGAVDLIGLYGSCTTGDTHDLSDLDLLILINRPEGRAVSDAFVLEDTGIGYDLYCTTWEGLEEEARCPHAHLGKLMDASVVWVGNPQAPARLEALRQQAKELLASPGRFVPAGQALAAAKQCYADCLLSGRLSEMRYHAGGAVSMALDALMLYHGRYFQKSIRRTFDETDGLGLPFDLRQLVQAVVWAGEGETLCAALTALMTAVCGVMTFQKEKAALDGAALAGTWEEAVSNWRGKLWDAHRRGDPYAAFINLVFCQHYFREIGADMDLLETFRPEELPAAAAAFDGALEQWRQTCAAAGAQPRRFAHVDDFLKNYLSKK